MLVISLLFAWRKRLPKPHHVIFAKVSDATTASAGIQIDAIFDKVAKVGIFFLANRRFQV